MKKCAIIFIAICLVVFSIPVLRVSANEGDYYFYGSDSWQLYDSSLKELAKCIYSNNDIGANFAFSSSLNNAYKSYNGYLYIYERNFLVFDTSDISVYFMNSYTNNSEYQYGCFISDSPFNVISYSFDGVNSPVQGQTYTSGVVNVDGLGNKYIIGLGKGSSWVWNFDNLNGHSCVVNNYVTIGGYGNKIHKPVYSDFPLYSIYEDSSYTFGNNATTSFSIYCTSIYNEYTPLNSVVNAHTLDGVVSGYETGVGVLVPEYESNENHLYLKNIDAGFCKPYGISDLSFAGGGYVYLQYSYDNWVNSHSSDYQLDIRTTVQLGQNFFNGMIKRSIDLQGLTVIDFKALTDNDNWTESGFLFVEFPETLYGNYKKGYVYSVPYPTFVDNRSRFLGNGRNRLFLSPSGGRNGIEITNSSIGSALEESFNIQNYDVAYLSMDIRLIDSEGNTSGSYIKRFNLKTGVGSVYDTSITNNQNPFEPDYDLPSIPDGTDSDNNAVTYPSNNSGITFTYYQGDTNVTIDYGGKELEEILESKTLPSLANLFQPFRDNALVAATSDYIGILPDDLQNIMFTCGGVLMVFVVWRFIRRG